jgi:galactokinase
MAEQRSVIGEDILDERLDWIREEFQRVYEVEPEVWASAPGRVDLMGSHTDYNHGFVLTMSIAYDTVIAARPRADQRVRIASANTLNASEFSLQEIRREVSAPWSNYVRGVAKVLLDEGFPLSGFDGLIHSRVPMASGLSSSAALEVATARLFVRISAGEPGLFDRLDPISLAVLCQRAENDFVGMNCGVLDQYTASVCPIGQALLLDCRQLSHSLVKMHPSVRVVICDTRSKRELTGSEYPERRSACECTAARFAQWYPGATHLRDVSLEQFAAHEVDLEPQAAQRARFILEENQRVLDLARALTAGELEAIRSLADRSFTGARDQYEIVSPAMEKMMGAMLAAPGVIGARQAGAGFGGCMVAFVQAGQEEVFSLSVKQAYLQATRIEPGIYLAAD